MGERGAVHTFRAAYTRLDKTTGRRIRKQTSGYAWRFAFHGKRYAGGGAYPTRADARTAGEARKREVVAGQIQDPRKTTYETLEALIKAEYSLRGKSQQACLGSCLRWLQTFFGGRLAGEIQRSDLIAYINARRTTPTRGNPGASDNTIKAELKFLKRAMNLAHESGKLLAVPKFPSLPTYPRKSFVRVDQWEAILAHLPAWWGPAYEVGYITGWRFRSEILSRTWADVDWQAGFLRLNTGEGKKRRARVYPLTERLREILIDQAARVEAQEKQLRKVIAWCFPGPKGNRMANPYGCWSTACRKAGVIGKQPHDLRRTFVRDLNLARVPAPAGMAVSGHTDERTYRGYTGNDEELIRWAVEQLEEQRAKPGNVVAIRRSGPAL